MSRCGRIISSCFDVTHKTDVTAESYGRRGALGLQTVRNQLVRACTALDHEFWPDNISLRDDHAVDFNRVHGHNQVPDLYLLASAVHHRGQLVSFDQNIPLDTVHGATTAYLRICEIVETVASMQRGEIEAIGSPDVASNQCHDVADRSKNGHR